MASPTEASACLATGDWGDHYSGDEYDDWLAIDLESTRNPREVVRFQKVRGAVWTDPMIDLAGLAIDPGYSDQPHMARQFRRYSGQTPAQFARSSMAEKKWLAA